ADVPAYVIFSDVALRQMARDCPTNEQEFLQISGVGKRKLEEFGPKFLAVIARHLEDYAPLTIPKESNPPPAPLVPSRRRPLGETVHETLRCFRSGYSIEQIAKERGLVTSTIYGHLEQAIQAGEPVDLTQLWTPEQKLEMTGAFEKTGFGNLTGAKELLGDLYDYGQLRLFRAVYGKNGND
ncbi:MAG: helix-turn-helix domain-containing protein, partial [Nitrospira sp.]